VSLRGTMPKRTWVRALNGILALALAAFLLGSYWRVVETFDLHRADLGVKGEWVGDHARLVTAVTAGGAADRAGLRPGDILEFDPNRNDDWVLASYREMPAGFIGTLPVRHADGSRGFVTLMPERVAYLSGTMDRLALIVRLGTMTVLLLLYVLLVWTHPCVMTWSLFLAGWSVAPFRVWAVYYFAFAAGTGPDWWSYAACTWALVVALLPFGLSFPRDTVQGLSTWQRALGLSLLLGVVVFLAVLLFPEPFEFHPDERFAAQGYAGFAALSVLLAVMAMLRTYRHSSPQDRARVKWALLGMSISLVAFNAGFVFTVFRSVPEGGLSGSVLTVNHCIGSVASVGFMLSIGYAVLRQRVVDVQFAVSRTVAYGAVTTVVLVFIALLHWLLGRMIEHSGLAFGLEGLAAVGLGLVLHRASHGINTTVDRVLFRKHHAAEERLRQVTAALPFATTGEGIAQSLVDEPAQNLELVSAALFYRESAERPLQRVRSEGWGDSHAACLDPESLLVRYLQTEHAALRLDDEQQWLPPGMPEGSAYPVLAIPIVTQHTLNAVVLYGSHVNGTLPDPDEVELLTALAKAAATSHQQVRIATLLREREAQQRQIDQQQDRIGYLEETAADLRELVRARLGGA